MADNKEKEDQDAVLQTVSESVKELATLVRTLRDEMTLFHKNLLALTDLVKESKEKNECEKCGNTRIPPTVEKREEVCGRKFVTMFRYRCAVCDEATGWSEDWS